MAKQLIYFVLQFGHWFYRPLIRIHESGQGFNDDDNDDDDDECTIKKESMKFLLDEIFLPCT